MKKVILVVLAILIIKPVVLYSDPLHTREMMMQVVTSGGSPVAKTVKMYKNFGYYFELYRAGTSESYWRWTAPNANVACDIGDDNTNNPTWEPIAPGNYLLWCDNKFATLNINQIPIGGDGDFSIKFQNGTFTIIFNNRGVTLGSTQDWNKVVATFGQKKSDGSTNLGNVSIGLGSSFSQRYSAPNEFYTNRNETYLFDADPEIYNFEKYHHYQNITDVRNFREQFIGTQNYSTTAVFNSTQPGIVIGNFFPENPSLNPDDDEIQFKDPWLIDYNDPLHGNKKRNRGAYGAIFQSLPSPFYPDYSRYYNGNVYKGLFLDQQIVSGQAYYSVNAISPQPVMIQGDLRNCYFQGWTYNPDKISLQYPDLKETPVVFKTSDATLTAKFKSTQLSDNTNAYSNNSQRKFVKTPDNVLHNVYSSMDRVWYELSTDGGTTWILGNGGKPLSAAESKNPTMSFYGNAVTIVWQEKSGYSFKIKIAVFYSSNYSSSTFGTVSEEDVMLLYSHNANPVIASGYNGKALIVWSGSSDCFTPFYSQSLKYTYGDVSHYGFNWIKHCAIELTDASSINPTIIAEYTDDISNPFNYHLTWEQVINASNSKVNYCRLFYQNNNIQQSAIEEASLNSGYTKNYKPLITLRKAFGWEFIYISWIGYRQSVAEGAELEKINFDQMGETRALLRYKLGANWSAIGVYGNSVASQSFNRGTSEIDRQQVLGFAWSENNGLSFVNKIMKFPVSLNIFTLNTTGKDVQVNNSVSLSDMFANSYQTVSSPFNFNLSQNFNSLSKENALMLYNGREGVVGRNDGQFYFALGDIIVNGSNINFPQVPDSITISTLAELNHYLTSEPFTVDNSSSLIYGVQYGITDTLSCISALENEREVKFRVELFDPMSNDIIGIFDNVTFNQNNVIQYENIGYQVDLTGIGNRTLKLRLVVDYSPDFSFNLSDRYADESILAKNNLRTINYKGSLAVTEYALEQNYPNPFNPSTTIRYQIPNDGLVTLKVYDILGSEVATLVNEEKTAGRYEVTFNAVSLASGVYLYKIQSGNFVQTKKMIILK